MNSLANAKPATRKHTTNRFIFKYKNLFFFNIIICAVSCVEQGWETFINEIKNKNAFRFYIERQ